MPPASDPLLQCFPSCKLGHHTNGIFLRPEYQTDKISSLES